MASISIIKMTSWDNPYSWLPGALGLSPCHGGSLRAPFLFGSGDAGMADHTKLRVWTSLFFSRPAQRDVPVKSRFLVRPGLLTRH
jgi:hypothetical protein